jgi:hypothetical protein
MKKTFSFFDLLVSQILLLPFVPVPIGARATQASTARNHPSILLSKDDRESVEVTRRRTGDGGSRERADAPSRRQRDGEPPSSRGGGGSGGGNNSSGPELPIGDIIALLLRLPLPVLAGLILIVCCVAIAFFVLVPSDSLPEPTQVSAPAIVTQAPTQLAPSIVTRTSPTQTPSSPTRTANTPAASSSGSKWLVMLYQDAKDRVLDQDIFTDLNEAERTGSTDRVRIVAQIDRYRSSQNSREWSSAKRFYISRDADLHTVRSQQVADLGQVNMADAKTLIDFATWAIKTYPSDKYVLIMSDHGMGWPGGWSDPAIKTGALTNRNVPLASSIGNLMYLNDIDQALGAIRSQTGVSKFELIGMDACLMSQMEVLTALAPHGKYAVASEETEPALGWAYTGFLDALASNPDMTGADLARAIVKTYIDGDQRIVDDQARAEFTSRGSTLGGLFGSGVPSADSVARELGADVTLTAIDLQTFPNLAKSLNNLVFALQQADSKSISQARRYAQSYTSIFGKSVPASYIDLGNWIELLLRSNSTGAVSDAAKQVQAALKTTVIAEKHGPGKPGSTGIAIYFPNSQLYGNAETGAESYTAIANRFASESLWDDFLTYFYTGRRFTQSAGSVSIPARGTTITAPSAGGIQISPLTLSAKTVARAKTVSLSVDVDGANVGYVKLFVGFYDKKANSINVADEDFLQSSQTRDVSGVYYPVWPSNKFTVKFQWEPIVFAINDGKKSVPALFTPETYGASQKDAVYTVEGIYTFVDGSGSRPARLYFRDKILRQVFGFTNDGSSAPREITTKPGDTFTVTEKWIDLDARGNATKTSTQKGATLTFGDQPFTWKDLDAAAGEYFVGFTVEDLDGNPRRVFERITVQ